MRAALTMLLLAGVSFAQTVPDFSGIFLRTETRYKKETEPAIPRVLEIKQTANEIVVTATQNRDTGVVHYRFAENKKDGPQVKFKDKALIVRTTYVARIPWAFPDISDPMQARWGIPETALPYSERVEKRWELSPDGQQLTIRTKINSSDRSVDIYRRQPSVDVAMAAAAGATRKDCTSIKQLLGWKEETSAIWKYENGANLGGASVLGVSRCVWYEAVLSGGIFKDLKRIKDARGTHFVRASQPIGAYDSDVVVEVSPRPSTCFREAETWTPAGTPPPDMSLRLRFKVRWTGEVDRDLGEVKSEFLYEPWRELASPIAFYRMQIPAQDVPLSDDLEITISAEGGEELACIKGHI